MFRAEKTGYAGSIYSASLEENDDLYDLYDYLLSQTPNGIISIDTTLEQTNGSEIDEENLFSYQLQLLIQILVMKSLLRLLICLLGFNCPKQDY